MHSLETFSLQGFRSIKQLDNFTFGPITVLIGANGSGKSNLIGFFRMMNEMMLGGLQRFLQSGGGASNFLHFGPKRTRFLNATLNFRSDRGLNTYRCELTFAAVDRLMFVNEELQFQENKSNFPKNIPIENNEPVESQLSRYLDPSRQTERFIKGFLDKTRVFHLHDTSITSRMRNYCDPGDARYLLAEAGNLAAVLLRLSNEYPANYRRIVAGVNTIFPELKDFDLGREGNDGKGLLLRWRPTSNPAEVFGPAHLSDGTLRMIALVTLFNLPDPMSSWMIILDEPELGLHPAAEAYLASLVRSASTQRQILLSTQSATLVDHFKPSEVVVAEMHEGASTFSRLDEEKLGHWLKRYTLGEALAKERIRRSSRMNLFIYVEGQEEEMFVNRILRGHLHPFGVNVQKPVLAATSFRIGDDNLADITVGGVTNYDAIREDILNQFATVEITAADVLTTLIDLYALPVNFPGCKEAMAQNLAGSQKALLIEQAWKKDIRHPNFFPYIQVHEFEALILTRPSALGEFYPEHAAGIEQLRAECAPFHTPEDINEEKATSPSHRILHHIPTYRKIEGFRHVQEIGIPELKAHCPRFKTWVEQCEKFFR